MDKWPLIILWQHITNAIRNTYWHLQDKIKICVTSTYATIWLDISSKPSLIISNIEGYYVNDESRYLKILIKFRIGYLNFQPKVPVQDKVQNDGSFSFRGEPSEDQVAHYSNWKEQQKAPAFLSTPHQLSVW